MSRSYLRNVFQTFIASFKHLRVHLSSSIKRTCIDIRYFRATRFRHIHQPLEISCKYRVRASHPPFSSDLSVVFLLKDWLLSDNKTDSRSLVPRAIDTSRHPIWCTRSSIYPHFALSLSGEKAIRVSWWCSSSVARFLSPIFSTV